MTTEPTGRELDAWLAEHAEQYRWMRVTDASRVTRRALLPPYYAALCKEGGANGDERIAGIAFDEHVPHYSTDLTAAMQLAEKMMKDGYTITLAMNGMPEYTLQGYRYFCCIGKLVKDQKEAGSQESLPEAIALAAFRALRGGDDA